jgi:hypothetical protein
MVPLLATSATSSSKRLDADVTFSIAGDIIRLQPNLVRRWKLVISGVLYFDPLDG